MAKIKIGKNVIENLTTGMYEDSKIIYREYIQNAADQIDKVTKLNLFNGEKLYMAIEINREKRRISIYDNATGIKADEVAEKLANVADSDKEKGIDKGFRGIGRLGGLAYCDQLKFITSYKGEKIKTTMTWDAKKCREMIEDPKVKKSAEEILNEIIKYEFTEWEEDDHFFIVQMIDIRKENNELLDEDKICTYVAWNAPVPYNNEFLFKSKIENYIKQNNYKVDEYEIRVNGDDIHKRYKDKLYERQSHKKYDELYDVEFKEFYNKKGELLAWMWFGISCFKKNIPASSNEMKGIRLRKENIQIGDSTTLDKFFKETRGNGYYVGEVHAVHKDLIPNARRDYFNENETRVEFDAELKYYFKEKLHKVYHDANTVKNAFKKINGFKGKNNELETKQFVNKEERKRFEEGLEQAEKTACKAEKEIIKFKNKSQSDKVLRKVIQAVEKEYNKSHNINIKNEEESNQKLKPINRPNKIIKEGKASYLTNELSKLNKGERKVVERIYIVIKNVLPPESSDELINKIQSELKK